MSGRRESVLAQILQPKFLKYSEIWLRNASKRELKGLKVISSVVLHKGEKRFKSKPQVVAIEDQEVKKPDYLRSSYDFEFNQSRSEAISSTSILKFRKLSDLPYSDILSTFAQRVLQRWLDLNDNEEYQALALNCLRGLSSCIKIHSGAVTTQSKDTYTWKLPEIKKISVQAPQAPSYAPKFEPLKEIKEENSKQEHVFVTAQHIKAKYNNMNQGFLNHVASFSKATSSYQATYVPNFSKQIVQPRKNFYSSMSVKVLPTISQ